MDVPREAVPASTRELMLEPDVYSRGQIPTVAAGPSTGRRRELTPRAPQLTAGSSSSPDALRDRVDVASSAAPTWRGAAPRADEGCRELPSAARRERRRGSPTLLASVLTGATIVSLSGSSARPPARSQVAQAPEPCSRARGVDLLAQERTFGPFDSSPVLLRAGERDGRHGGGRRRAGGDAAHPGALEPELAAAGPTCPRRQLPLPDEDGPSRSTPSHGGSDLQLLRRDDRRRT